MTGYVVLGLADMPPVSRNWQLCYPKNIQKLPQPKAVRRRVDKPRTRFDVDVDTSSARAAEHEPGSGSSAELQLSSSIR
jgi:hypothetical protein